MASVISKNAMTILEKRYFAPGENADGMFRRVSLGNEDYEKLMSDLLFLPNSPTLFNAGLNNGCTLSACFVFDIVDCMVRDNGAVHPQSIVRTREKAIEVAKAGGGVGYYGGNLRAKNSPIKSIHRKACGPVNVLRDYNAIGGLITQGGKRDLAQMFVLPAWHPDIKDFIHCKDADPQSLSSFNISVSWDDKLLAEAFSGSGEAKSIWDEQVDSAWRHGCPGMLFYNTVNRANPNIDTVGLINATNPCGETPNRSDEPCNLGSLALRRMVTKNREVNWNLLEETVYRATFFLDDVLDANVFPHPDITKAAMATRKLGLGVMGWADMLAKMHIHYDTEAAVSLANRLMKFINGVSLQARIDLVKKKGRPYEAYDDVKTAGPCVRNETGTSIAPTGTIGILADCSSSIEPHPYLAWERTTNEGIKLTERIQVLDELEGFIPKTAQEIHWSWHVKHQASFQAHTDLGVSKTINLRNDATRQDVSDAYRMMFELQCKGGTVFRDGCRDEQVLVGKKTSVYSLPSTNGNSETHKPSEPVAQQPTDSGPLFSSPSEENPRRKQLPDRCGCIRQKFRIGDFKGYLHAGLYPDGTLGEIFITAAKEGSTISGLLDSWATDFSLAIQYGTPLADLCRKHEGARFEPAGLTNVPSVPICTSIVDFIVRWLEAEFLGSDKSKSPKRIPGRSGHLCPDCGSETIYQAGCLACPKVGCGWSRCG